VSRTSSKTWIWKGWKVIWLVRINVQFF
jgi:hypothetical protein